MFSLAKELKIAHSTPEQAVILAEINKLREDLRHNCER